MAKGGGLQGVERDSGSEGRRERKETLECKVWGWERGEEWVEKGRWDSRNRERLRRGEGRERRHWNAKYGVGKEERNGLAKGGGLQGVETDSGGEKEAKGDIGMQGMGEEWVGKGRWASRSRERLGIGGEKGEKGDIGMQGMGLGKGRGMG